MKAAPLLSVITPSFNHAHFIRQTIDSVLNQDYPAVEHIVVDGGSTDGTTEILREYGRIFPDRFRWVSEPDRGQSDAFNKGLRMACGEIIGWQNSDDYYAPAAFSSIMQCFRSHPDASVVYSNCSLVDDDGNVVDESFVGPFDFDRLFRTCFVMNQAAFIRRDALLAVGGLDENLHQVMDFDLFLRLALRYSFVYLPGIRASFRLLTTAKTNTARLRGRLETVEVLERIIADPLLSYEHRSAAQSALLSHAHEALIVALGDGNLDVAEKLLGMVGRLDPSFRRWHCLCSSILRRRVITADWYGILEDEHSRRIPQDLLALVTRSGISSPGPINQTIALALLFRALDQPARSRAVAYSVAAARYDAQILCSGEAMVALARLLFGHAAVDHLNPALTAIRSASHAKASQRGSMAAARVLWKSLRGAAPSDAKSGAYSRGPG